MNNVDKLQRYLNLYILGAFAVVGAVTAVVWVLVHKLFALDELYAAIVTGGIGLGAMVLAAHILSRVAMGPFRTVAQAIIHLDPNHQNIGAPDLKKIRVGRELITNLCLQVYQFASHEDGNALIKHRSSVIQAANIVSRLPLPLFAFNKDLQVTNASEAAMKYCGIESSQLFGKPIFDSLSLEFSNDNTLEKWITECQDNKVNDTAYWERVRVRIAGGAEYRQCDMSAYYDRENPSGTEFIVTLFDRTEQYSQDDESMSFVSLAVHELRTPLTMLRGYIEVFQEELEDTMPDELRSYLQKMEASASQLSNFVHNILNVTKVENNQLSLHLTEESWPDVLRKATADVEIRAKVNGKTIEYELADGLPTVAVDHTSIFEVIENLLDNAIKYSVGAGEKGNRIIVRSKVNQDGLVETEVQDFGVGITASVVPNLFEKFYRNHRTKGQINGTGLGLYLCKALITAHGGKIWAKSKEGEGTTIGFTLVPYAQLSAEMKSNADTGIVRQANGWIKNHSYYRS